MGASSEWAIQIHNDRMATDAEYAENYERDREEEAAAHYYECETEQLHLQPPEQAADGDEQRPE